MSGIIYAVISRGSIILTEYTATKGNFTAVAPRILDKIPVTRDTKVSYVYDKHIFHCVVSDGLAYMCMTDESFPRRIPFAFLSDIQQRFRQTYGERAVRANAYEMDEDFRSVLRSQMEYFSNNPSADRVTRVRGEIEEVKGIMLENIEKVLDRGERIELLVDKTNQLKETSYKFKVGSSKLKRHMWLKNVKLWVILSVVLVVVVFFIVVGACGGFTFPRCKQE